MDLSRILLGDSMAYWIYAKVETLDVMGDDSMFVYGFHVFDGEVKVEPHIRHTGSLNEVLYRAGYEAWEMVSHGFKPAETHEGSYYNQIFLFKKELSSKAALAAYQEKRKSEITAEPKYEPYDPHHD